MSRDPGIIRFAHCEGRRTYCREVPKVCPICGSELTSFVEEPFRLVYPCVDATQNPCSVAVRPSSGSFLEDYAPQDDLHIGVVDSHGRVFEFDACGLKVDDSSAWKDCLTFEVIPESWRPHWDVVLSELSESPRWARKNYHPESANCFTFVVDFFKALKFPDLEFRDKEDFCASFVLPKIRQTVRYVSVYRKLRDARFYIP